MISLIIIEVTQKIRIMETIMNRIFQKFLQSVIDLSSVGAKCREDNTHDIDMNPDAEVPIPEWRFILTETSGSLQEKAMPEQNFD